MFFPATKNKWKIIPNNLMNANKTNLAKQTIAVLATVTKIEWIAFGFVIMYGNWKKCA